MKKYLIMLFMMLGMTVSALAQETLEITGTAPMLRVNLLSVPMSVKRMIRDLELLPTPMDIIR